MSVKRYDIGTFGGMSMESSSDGAYVHHEDYAALEARCAALAVELRTVEAIHNDAVFITDEHYEQCPAEVQKIIRSLAVMQIPSYQAFQAEVRAQGVEMLAAFLRRKGDDSFFDAIAEAQANAADQFAAQIRKGSATEEGQSFLSDEDCHAFVEAFTKGAAQ
ncbi:hypothetical protein [Enterobacter bugandensis]|uniref:hypothetical protein n=1 Tax=Enterobacter bugandensis TaxID=881260 RepID=UPI001F276743|nr:hypothetical protein [Enterobacter bugandensis]